MKHLIVASILTGVLFNIFSGVPHTPPDHLKDIGLAQIGGNKIDYAYQRWAARHEAQGGDHNVVVRLGSIPWLSVDIAPASGVARFDLVDGKVALEVTGLPVNETFDVWLVDNLPAPGHSTKPDFGDDMIALGTLQHTQGSHRLDRILESRTFESFHIDLVVITPSGGNPVEAALLSGSTPLFQRVYSALHRNQLLASSGYDVSTKPKEDNEFLALLGIHEAHAKGANIPRDTLSVDPDAVLNSLVQQGANLFVNETFDGNGRTCATCHPAANNFTIDPTFIAGLPDDDPLFVAEFFPALANNFEKPLLMRGSGLILENIDGFDDLANKFVMRSVPHMFALSTSTIGPEFPYDNTSHPNLPIPPVHRTGWGGDGAPGTGSLRDFAIGAVIQHFPLSTNRMNGVDFRLPTDAELDAMEAFQLSLGREADINITPGSPGELVFTDPVVEFGKILFNRVDTGQGAAGKCIICHNNAGANVNAPIIATVLGNVGVKHSDGTTFDPSNPVHVADVEGNGNFGTGVNELGAIPADLIDPSNNPRDGGFGNIPHIARAGVNCGSVGRVGFGAVTLPGALLHPSGEPAAAGLCEEDFNTPPLVEAADTPPFFHNNAVATIEAAVAFYNDDAFNQTAGGQLLAAGDSKGIGIRLDTSEVTAIASMLRVINSLENIRSAKELAEAPILTGRLSDSQAAGLIAQALAETEDSYNVLEGGGLHPRAVLDLSQARKDFREALTETGVERDDSLTNAIALLNSARSDMVN